MDGEYKMMDQIKGSGIQLKPPCCDGTGQPLKNPAMWFEDKKIYEEKYIKERLLLNRRNESSKKYVVDYALKGAIEVFFPNGILIKPLPTDVPYDLFCPITGELIKVPVMLIDGYTYEASAIKQWLEKKNTSPVTREQVVFDEAADQQTQPSQQYYQLFPNVRLNNIIQTCYPKYYEEIDNRKPALMFNTIDQAIDPNYLAGQSHSLPSYVFETLLRREDSSRWIIWFRRGESPLQDGRSVVKDFALFEKLIVGCHKYEVEAFFNKISIDQVNALIPLLQKKQRIKDTNLYKLKKSLNKTNKELLQLPIDILITFLQDSANAQINLDDIQINFDALSAFKRVEISQLCFSGEFYHWVKKINY
jgi:hypothetical protein